MPSYVYLNMKANHSFTNIITLSEIDTAVAHGESTFRIIVAHDVLVLPLGLSRNIPTFMGNPPCHGEL